MTRQATQYHFGISLASLIPQNVFFPIEEIVEALAELGFEFLQGGPFRGVSGYENFAIPVKYKEPTWNGVDSLSQALFGQGDDFEKADLKDWLAFPETWIADQVFHRLPGRVVSHEFSAGDRLVELNPKIKMTAEKIVDKCQREGYDLVIDTKHMFEDNAKFDPLFDRMPNHFGRTVDEKLAKIRIISPSVDLLHVKATDGLDRRILDEFLRSPHRQQLDVLAEYPPIARAMDIPKMFASAGFRQQKRTEALEYASHFLHRLKNIFNQN